MSEQSAPSSSGPLQAGGLGGLVRSIWATALHSRRGIGDVVVSLLPQGVTLVSGVTGSVILARGLGPSGMGQYALILSVSTLLVALSDLGITGTAIRYASRASAASDVDGERAVLRWALRLRLLLALAGSVLTWVVAPFITEHAWHQPELTGPLRLGLVGALLAPLVAFPSVTFQARRSFRWNALSLVAQSLFVLGGIVAVAIAGVWSLERVVLYNAAALLVTTLALVPLVPRGLLSLRTKGDGTASLWRPPKTAGDDAAVGTFALYSLLSAVVVTIGMKADVWLMGAFLPASDVGLYSVAMRFTLPLTMLLGAVQTVLLPRASVARSLEETTGLLRRTLQLSGVLTAACIGYALVAPLVTPLLFGARYGGATFLAQLLCLRYCISILVCPVGLVGYNLGLVRAYVGMNLVQLVAIVSVNLLLLPRIGALGSAVALLTNELLGFGVTSWLIARHLSAQRRAAAASSAAGQR